MGALILFSYIWARTASHWRMKVRSWGAKFCALTNDIVFYFNATRLFVESETFIIPSHPIYISRIYESNISSRDFDSVSMPTENFRIDDQMSIRRDKRHGTRTSGFKNAAAEHRPREDVHP